MIVRNAVLSVAAALMAIGFAAADDKTKVTIDGTYTVEKATRGGMEPPAEALSMVTFEFKGNKVTIHEPMRDEEAELTLDTTKTPHKITIKPKSDKEVNGIFKIEGDKLTLCVNEGDSPTKFESPEGSRIMLLVLKRKK